MAEPKDESEEPSEALRQEHGHGRTSPFERVSSDSQEDYLEALLVLIGSRSPEPVRASDLARFMGYSKPSVGYKLASLVEQGLVSKGSGGHLRLSREGLNIAHMVLEKHVFFRDQLQRAGVSHEQAEREANVLKHAISDGSFCLLRDAWISSDVRGRR